MNIQNDTEVIYDKVACEYTYNMVLQQFLTTLLAYYYGISKV